MIRVVKLSSERALERHEPTHLLKEVVIITHFCPKCKSKYECKTDKPHWCSICNIILYKIYKGGVN